MNRLERLQQSFRKKSVPRFEIGDTVRVHVKVVEGEKRAHSGIRRCGDRS